MRNNYQKIILLLCMICLTTGFSGCGQQKESQQEKVLKYDNTVNISKSKKHAFSNEINRLNCPNEIKMSLSVVDDIENLESTGIVDTIKYNNGKYYSVTNVEGDKYLFLLYDEYDKDESNKGYLVVDGCLVSKLADKSFFETVKVGMNKKDIIEKDPFAFIDSDYSYHRLNDKSILKIKYIKDGDQEVVSEISYLENPISVLDYLTEEDFTKIGGVK